jgi:[ribosomal protein S18]-alanine N-acetyltransferase
MQGLLKPKGYIMKKKINILKVNKNYDINKILELQNKCNCNILSKNNILDDLNNNNLYYIANIDENLVGYVSCSLLYDHVDISSILVDKDYLRKGIATLLITEVINYCKLHDIPNIFLEVRSNNLEAINLYTKLNFKQISTRKNYYNNDDALIYKLKIED